MRLRECRPARVVDPRRAVRRAYPGGAVCRDRDRGDEIAREAIVRVVGRVCDRGQHLRRERKCGIIQFGNPPTAGEQERAEENERGRQEGRRIKFESSIEHHRPNF